MDWWWCQVEPVEGDEVAAANNESREDVDVNEQQHDDDDTARLNHM